MKKYLLIAALLCGTSVVSMASSLPSKKQEISTPKAITKNAKIHDLSKLSEEVLRECGWVHFNTSCGAIGYSYCCNMEQVVETATQLEEEWCGN